MNPNTLTAPSRVIFHIDMDAFFASCSQLQNPHLQNQPVAVAHHHRRAIISATSYEAKKYQIQAAMPLYKARQQCPQLIVVEPDFQLYHQISRDIWNLVQSQFSTKIEIISIDECYLDVTHLLVTKGWSVQKIAVAIQSKIYHQFHLTCSIGISDNKFLAKMASKLQKPNGFTVLDRNNLVDKMWPLAIDEMYGVGLAGARLLKTKYQIQTIGDLKRLSLETLQTEFGTNGILLYHHVRGYGSYILNQKQVTKSISNETTLAYPTNNLQTIEELLFKLTKNTLLRLKKQGLVCKTVGVVIRYQHRHEPVFDKLEHLKRTSKRHTFCQPTNELELIFATVKECFAELYHPEKMVLLIGVVFTNLMPFSYFSQISFLDGTAPLNHNAQIEQLIININHKYRKKIVFYGSHLIV